MSYAADSHRHSGGWELAKAAEERTRANTGERSHTSAQNYMYPISARTSTMKDQYIDGFHGAFYHGNWRALHHHAACWLVNIHVTWPFALQLPQWKDAMESVYSYSGQSCWYQLTSNLLPVREEVCVPVWLNLADHKHKQCICHGSCPDRVHGPSQDCGTHYTCQHSAVTTGSEGGDMGQVRGGPIGSKGHKWYDHVPIQA